MKELAKMYKNTGSLLHAYGISGEREEVLSELLSFFETVLKVAVQRNPDFHVRTYDTFGIDEGRALQILAMKKAFGGDRQVFILSFQSITREAQNALLKLFEEPTPNTHFFIIAPTLEVLLPTLRSRLMILSGESRASAGSVLAHNFLAASKGERLLTLKEIMDAKDKGAALVFLNDLEAVLREQTDFEKIDKKEMLLFDEIRNARSYLNDRAASVKMLLEHIALTTP